MAKSDKNRNTAPAKKSSKVRVNFEGVETRTHIPDDEYRCKVAEVTLEEGQAAQYLKWKFELIHDVHGGRMVYTNTSLAPQALWNLRNLLETMGVDTPDSEFDLDLDAYVDLELIVRIENEVYEGKERPKVTDYKSTVAEVTDDEAKPEGAEKEEEVEEKEEEETDDRPSAEEIREMDEAELKDLIRKHKLNVDFKVIVKPGKRIAAVIDAMESKDLLRE